MIRNGESNEGESVTKWLLIALNKEEGRREGDSGTKPSALPRTILLWNVFVRRSPFDSHGT